MNSLTKSYINKVYSASASSEELRSAILQGLIDNDRQYLMTLHNRKMQLLAELNSVSTSLERKAEDILILEGMLYAE
jgi:hypothetical protein